MFKPALPRRRSRQIRVGNVAVGGDAPISVQTMTNTETCDVAATVAQIGRAAKAGADIVRVSVPSMAAAEAFGEIRKRSDVPLVADIHFDYRIALRVAELGADCLRVNPGNIGREDRVRAVVQSARDHGIPIRIGVNAGSLEKDLQKKYGEPTPQALVESALRHIDIRDRLDFQDFKVSLKASDVFLTVEAYKLLAGQIEQPLHLGITEAGGLRSGSVKSAIGLGMILAAGIGDTIRVSLAADPVEEVKVGFDEFDAGFHGLSFRQKSSGVCTTKYPAIRAARRCCRAGRRGWAAGRTRHRRGCGKTGCRRGRLRAPAPRTAARPAAGDRKSTRLNSSH